MRYKEFNKNKVLEDCIALFWKQSFNGSSIQAIVEKTKVNRFSLYQEFDNKEGILIEALKLYKERYCDKYVSILDSHNDINNVLTSFFQNYLMTGSNPAGCFIIYIATELGDNNAYVNSFLKSYLYEIETKLIALINSSVQYKQDAEIIASNLILLFCNSMCYCHIQEKEERDSFVSLNLEIILNK